ncbi:amidotransferase [Paenibacillus sp. CAA11]|uniref:gamma-glutamyl-gamma-aminobutyrate hydrolase family protein n=1 Tax=Paenibacillus sp. CAA11 TaxID=1532905 RepID=UPI000D333A57|nr:gamma-glutamyl-gamma-aminobutyrate hydrolase family protein [Paenibacillus sp. CAA11]AWB43860.1 amidotransferase [Paenibacillus sp. CAA11]
MNKPVIGVVPLYDKEKESYWMVQGYMKGVEDAGGIPVMLPLTTNPEAIRTMADTFDGFLFTGGQDVDPAWYGEKKEPCCGEVCEERDKMEKMLLERVLEQDKPAFGICRGLQLFNVCLGGTLYQDLPSQRASGQSIVHKQEKPYTVPAHQVYIEEGNFLSQILGTESISVNSCHHQGIRKLAEPLLAAAIAEDGLIEAVYMPDKKFMLAVQWHPELIYTSDPLQFKLFQAFVKSCEC